MANDDSHSSKLTKMQKHMLCLNTKKLAVTKQTSITDLFKVVAMLTSSGALVQQQKVPG